jgi:diguanylate cyclase (GGDEF)-like protein
LTGARVTPDPGNEPAHRSGVAEQLQQGFPWLRFQPELEKAFRQEHHEQGLVQLRLNITLALGLVLAFIAMNRMMPPPTGTSLGLLRHGVLLPALLACLGATFVPHGWRFYGRVVAVAAPAALLAVVALTLGDGEARSLQLFPVLVLATLFAYYLVGLGFYGAVRTNLLVLAAFVVGAMLVDIPAEQTSYQALLLFFANLVGTTTAYSLESARRMGWLESRLLGEMAERDGLTGAYNRRRLDSHLRRAWQQGIREHCHMALLMIDIDSFKAYNDRYGHQAGDEALKAVAGVLARAAARRPLDFVARYGGEEFLVVLYDTTRDYATGLAGDIVAAVRDLRIAHGASEVADVLTVSVGVAYVMPVAGRSADGFVQLADEALYAAKNGGRNRVHVMESEYAQLRTGSFRISNG